MAHHNLLSNKNKKKELARIYEEFEVYRGLKPTTKPKKEFKQLYKEIQARLISEGKFPNKQARDLNRAILKEIGEFPYWSHGGTTKQNNAAVEFGQGIVHKMSGGEARPAFLRNASNAASDAIRLQRTNWANDLMSAAGFETEVKEGQSLFSAKNRVGGKAWDHTYELQDFGPRYKAILEDFASGSIGETEFKTLVSQEVGKNPGDIKRNLKLLDEADNYSKRARVEAEVKQFKKAEAYKVRDVKYTEFKKLDDVTQAAKLDQSHQKAVKFMESLSSGKGTTNYTSVGGYMRNANKAAKAGKTAKVVKAGIGLATVGSLAAFGPAGAALSAVDTYQRSQKYKQTGNKLDGLQAWIAGASTGTSATGIGEVISMPLDVTNLLIDAARYKRTGPIQGSRARFN